MFRISEYDCLAGPLHLPKLQIVPTFRSASRLGGYGGSVDMADHGGSLSEIAEPGLLGAGSSAFSCKKSVRNVLSRVNQ